MKKFLLGMLLAGIMTSSAYAEVGFTHHAEGFNKDDRIHGYFYQANLGQTGGIFKYDVPEGMCMDKSGLPAFLPFDSNATAAERIGAHRQNVDNVLRVTEVFKSKGIHLFEEMTDEKRRMLDLVITARKNMLGSQGLEGEEDRINEFLFNPMLAVGAWKLTNDTFVIGPDERNGGMAFVYSTDHGITWKQYAGYNDPDLPNDCSITNFQIQNIYNEPLERLKF